MRKNPTAAFLMRNYSILGAVIFLAVLFWLRNNSAMLSFKVLVSAVFLYIGLGYAYHKFDKTLTSEVIVEYILLGLLILMIVQSFLV